MDRTYEYTAHIIDWDSASIDRTEVIEALNHYTQDGWEYVQTVTPHTGRPVSVFRRALGANRA